MRAQASAISRHSEPLPQVQERAVGCFSQPLKAVCSPAPRFAIDSRGPIGRAVHSLCYRSTAHSGGSNVGFEKWGPGSQTRPLRFLNMLIRQRSPLMPIFHLKFLL